MAAKLPNPELINDVPLTIIDEAVLPTVDDEQPPQVTYQDWKAEDTHIVTYTIGNNYYKGIPATSRDEAKAHCEANHGKILQANYVQGRAFYRVSKVKS